MQKIIIVFIAFLGFFPSFAQTLAPEVNPQMVIDGESVGETLRKPAPLVVSFQANPQHLGEYQALYTWSIAEAGQPQNPVLVRREQDFNYTFSISGTWLIKLEATFIGSDTITQIMETPFTLTITSSKLDLPNAFSPNGDGINDVYKVKEGAESILSFKAVIFNRIGQKIYEWNDLNGGWNGTIGGKQAPEGVYFCFVEAKGADGIVYKFKKDVNLFRRHLSNSIKP